MILSLSLKGSDRQCFSLAGRTFLSVVLLKNRHLTWSCLLKHFM
uniref:Uncharacterized protein n=1 Tax=Anguilla anguilla TaxID=7936 RepID=A0A0E9PA31_ANGAN